MRFQNDDLAIASIGSRPPIRRFSFIISELLRKPRNASELAEMLEVSRKTVHRDLEYMRFSLNLPIQYNPCLRAFQVTEKVCICSVCSGATATTLEPAYA